MLAKPVNDNREKSHSVGVKRTRLGEEGGEKKGIGVEDTGTLSALLEATQKTGKTANNTQRMTEP